MKKLTTLALAVLMTTGLAACGKEDKSSEQNAEQVTQTKTDSADVQASNTPTEQMTIKTATGEQQIPANPHPLAVYDMTAMQNLAVLGVPVEGMPSGLRLNNLKAANTPESADIGTLFEPNLEALNALQPKAVLVGSRMAEKSEEIAKVAPVYNLTIDTNNVYEATKQQLTDFGKLFGKEAEAKTAITEIDAVIAEAQKAVAGKGNGLAILVNGNKLSAYGKNSRYGFLHTTFGIPMADEHIQEARHGQPISFEYLQKTDPDWLFVLDRGAAIGEEGESAESVLNNPLMHNTKAYKNGQIVYLSAESYLAFGGYYQWLTDARIVIDAFNAKNNP
ncbi:siderophore ABC transporter substrate-binding protein [Moraxella nasicaprae]|uniref:Siderophore ABC transporter substrate-binding protein n=1 Tax=Moraxella nasicaprae TaxID=2904122 RepID=A0ABY6F1Z7_9GAMM|nr:siderophore ABC transporter substrate-binding protein [Moraxella nasicaprae]UXZ04118.1 siderophore ABC transporter substrate-binding protein [Moraxella nasicaprae]